MKSIWQKYDNDSRTQYVQSVKALGALSASFRQKATSAGDRTVYISSKYQEAAFAKYFNGVVVDKGNGPYDVMVPSSIAGKQDLVGIKTFLYSSNSMQKVMQFKRTAVKEEWSVWIKNGEYQKLIERISVLRNQKLKFEQNLLAGYNTSPEDAFGNIFYHYLSPDDSGTVHVGESDYSLMDEQNLSYTSPDGSKKITSIVFTDGKKEYKYTPADSTLHMRFMHRKSVHDGGEIVDQFAVAQLEDPHESLVRMLNEDLAQSTPLTLQAIEQEEIQTASSMKPVEAGTDQRLFDTTPIVSAKVETTGLAVGEKSNRKKDHEQLHSKETASHDSEFEVNSGEIFVFPMFRLSKHKETPAGELDGESGLNLRCGGPKNIGSTTPRPVHEVEIKIPESRKFHEMFPEFFGVNDSGIAISKLFQEGKSWKSIFESKDDRSFELVLTQSDTSMEALIYGQSNKQIMSRYHQNILGEWIVSRMFQLSPYEPLDRKKLDEFGIDCIRLTRLGNRRVGLEFIKASDLDLTNFWPRKVETFLKLSRAPLG